MKKIEDHVHHVKFKFFYKMSVDGLEEQIDFSLVFSRIYKPISLSHGSHSKDFFYSLFRKWLSLKES